MKHPLLLHSLFYILEEQLDGEDAAILDAIGLGLCQIEISWIK